MTTCASPLCALKILRECGAEFNLLLVEVHMQEMGGFELISMIKKEFDDLHFISNNYDYILIDYILVPSFLSNQLFLHKNSS